MKDIDEVFSEIEYYDIPDICAMKTMPNEFPDWH